MTFFAAYGMTNGPVELSRSVDPLAHFSALLVAFPK